MGKNACPCTSTIILEMILHTMFKWKCHLTFNSLWIHHIMLIILSSLYIFSICHQFYHDTTNISFICCSLQIARTEWVNEIYKFPLHIFALKYVQTNVSVNFSFIYYKNLKLSQLVWLLISLIIILYNIDMHITNAL